MAPEPNLATRDRPRGILTKIDREFLQSDGDYYDGNNARQMRYQRRRNLCERIMHSLLDFKILSGSLDQKWRDKLFSDPEKYGAESQNEFDAALGSLVYWLYLGCRENGPDFNSLLENSAGRAEENYRLEKTGDIVDVMMTLEKEVVSNDEGIEKLAQRLMEGEPVDAEDIYRIPTLSQFPIDTEKVDVVRVLPSSKHISSEKKIVETILWEHLGIEVEVEVEGILNENTRENLGIVLDDEDTAVVPPEEDTP